MAACVEGERRGHDIVAGVVVAQESFRSLACPGNRAAKPPRRPQHQDILAEQPAFKSETAADVTAHDAHLCLRHTEDVFGQDGAELVRRLMSGVESIAPGALVEFTD